MEPIALAFTEGRFSYAQMERQGTIAIYRQQHLSSGKGLRYEVVRIRVMKQHTWPNGDVTPEHEGYPGASVWGRDGFTFFDLDTARIKMTQWVTYLADTHRVSREESPYVL